MLVRRVGYGFVDLAIEPLGALDEFPRRLLVDADGPLAVVEHQLHQGRDREPAGDLRTVGAHTVGDDHAVRLLVEPVGHRALRQARREGLLIASEPDDQEVVVARRSTEARMGDRPELAPRPATRTGGTAGSYRALSCADDRSMLVFVVAIQRTRSVHPGIPF